MSDLYDPEEAEARQEDAALAQEEAAQARLLTPPDESQGTTYGSPPEQAIPTNFPPPRETQAAPQQQPAPQQQQYAQIGETFDVSNFQPEQRQAPAQPQPQGGARLLAPYPQVTPRANRKEQGDADYQRRFGTIISDEDFSVRPDLAPQPTGGLGSVIGLDFSTMGHQMSSLAEVGLKQLGASPEYLTHFNEQWQQFNDNLKASLDPGRQAAAGVSAFDFKHLLEVAKENPGSVLESYLVTGATALAGGLGAGAAAKLATRTAARFAGVGVEGATRAGEVAGVAGAGVQGGAAGAGARYEDYAHTIDTMTPEEKANSAMYQGFQRQGMDDAAAREQMKLQFPTLQQFGANLIASTGLAAVTPGLRGNMWQRPTRAGNIGVGAVEAGVPGAVGTGASAAVQEQSKVAAGAQPAINWGQVGAEATLGGAVGGAIGGTFGAVRGRAPEPVRPPPDAGTPPPAPLLALPPPGDVPGTGFTMRRDTVVPSGVPPEHTAALNAAGIGRQAIQTEPGAQQFRPRGPDPVTIGADESFFAPPPPRYDLPPGTVLPPADPTAWRGPPPPLAPDTGPRLLTASPERGEGFTMRPPSPDPLQLTASRERGLGFEVQQPGAPVRAYEQPAGPPTPSPPLPPDTGPRLLTASPERGEGFTVQQPGAPVRAYEQPVGPPATSAIPPAGPPRLTAARERGEGFTVAEPAPEPAQVTASRERGEGFTTEPAPAPAPRPSEGLSARELIKRLAAEGMPQAQINRLVSRGQERLAAALDQRAQERAARGEEPAPAPRGAEAREPAPAARPSDGMSHRELGTALEDKGFSRAEVNKLLTREARATAYDKAVRDEGAAIERLAESRKGETSDETPPREQTENTGTKEEAPAEPAAPPRAEAKAPAEPVAAKAEAVKERAKARRTKREAAATARAEEVAATLEDAPPAPATEPPPGQASRQQRDLPTAASPLRRVLADDRVNAPVREALSRQPEGGSIHAPLRALAADPWVNRRMPHVAALARQLQRMLPENLQIRHTDDPALQGRYVYGGDEAPHIYVARNADATAVLHEAYHAVTARYFDQLPAGSREGRVLEAIRNELRQHLDPNDPLFAYALSDNHELHTIAKTSPELREAMSRAQPSAEYRARMAELGYPIGPSKSLWQSFVRFTRRMLGLPQNVTSLLDHVMRPLDDITAAAHRFNETTPAVRGEGVPTQRDLPSFGQVRDWVNERREGRAGNISSGARRGLRQGLPTEQLMGFNRHLFQPSTGGENHLDVLNRAMEGVERVSREYGERNQAAVTAAIKNLDPEVNHVLTQASRVDMNPAHPPDHPLNSHSRATADEFTAVQDAYRALSPAQRTVVTDTFNLTRQQRVDRGDAAMRGIGKAYLEGVNDAQVETMVRQMRTMEGVNEILANDTNPVARAFGDQWDGNREFVRAIATEWKRGWINNYVPLHRNGDWVVTYTDPDTGNPGMLSRYTRYEAETARQKLIDEGAEPSLVLSRERRTPSDIPRLSIVDQFAAKLERKLGPENREQIEAARDLLAKVMLDQSRFAGTMRKRLGVHGADPAKLPEAMSQNFLSLKNAMGHLEYGPQYDAGLAAMRRHVGEMGRGANTVKVRGENPTSADVIQAQQVLEEFRRRRPVSEDPNNILLKSVNNATMFTYFKFLASPAQTVMNGIETYMQGIPRIGAEFGLGRATTAMARASAEIMPRQFVRGLAGTKDVARGVFDKTKGLDPGEWNSADQIRDHLIQNSRSNDAAGITALFQRLQDGNLIGYSSYRDLQNMAKGTSGRVRGVVDTATDFVSILHNKMEDANRAVTALAAYDVHLSRHGDRAAAIDYADKILRKAQPNFNLSNKPRFATPQSSFGAWGIPVAQFRQHGMWAYSQMALDIRNAFKGADAATKTEARYALAFTIGMQTVLMGTLNWLADPLRYLWGAYDALTGGKPQNHEHDFRMAAAKIFGTTGGELFSRGLSRGLGYGPDVSHRIGMINPLLIPEFQGDFKNPKDVTYAAVTALAGVPAIGAGSEVITGLINFGAGNIMQAVQDLVPKVIRDPIKAYRGETEGQVSRRGNVQQTPEQISALDTAYRVFGFQSARQGERSEQTGSQRQFLEQVRVSREAATKEAAHALINGSASEKRAANEAVVAHNKRYPGSQIDPKDVFAYRKREIERLRDPSLTGITVSKGLRPAVRDVGAFANY